MVKSKFFVVCAILFGAILAQGQTVSIPPIANKLNFNSQVELKNKINAMFDSLGTDSESKYDVIVVTITHFKQTKRTTIDSNSVKLSNSGISATELTTGKTIKETITLRSGKIGDRTINNMEAGTPSVIPISSKVQIGTYVPPISAGTKTGQ